MMKKEFKQQDPCQNCFLPFMASVEDCSFCCHFAEACEYQETTIEECLTGFKPVKTSK